MLYAQMDKRRWENLPMQWEKCQDMHKYLSRMTWGYQITFESRMFSTPDTPMYRCTLIKWEDGRNPKPINAIDGKRREVLLETSDPAQMEATLFMLINDAEQEAKRGKEVMRWVP